MRLILVLLLAATLAIPAAAVGGQNASGSSQRAAAQGATEASQGKKGKKKKRKHQSRRSRTHTTTTTQASPAATDDEVEVKGTIVSLSPLTVGTTTCVVPVGQSLTGFAAGDRVEMTCDLVAGQWVLRRLKHEDAPRGKVEVKGVVASLSPLTVAGISCVVPPGMSLRGIDVGDSVEMKCRLRGGQWVVKKVELEDNDHSGPGHGDDDDDDDDEDDDDDNSGPGGGDDD